MKTIFLFVLMGICQLVVNKNVYDDFKFCKHLRGNGKSGDDAFYDCTLSYYVWKEANFSPFQQFSWISEEHLILRGPNLEPDVDVWLMQEELLLTFKRLSSVVDLGDPKYEMTYFACGWCQEIGVRLKDLDSDDESLVYLSRSDCCEGELLTVSKWLESLDKVINITSFTPEGALPGYNY